MELISFFVYTFAYYLEEFVKSTQIFEIIKKIYVKFDIGKNTCEARAGNG